MTLTMGQEAARQTTGIKDCSHVRTRHPVLWWMHTMGIRVPSYHPYASHHCPRPSPPTPLPTHTSDALLCRPSRNTSGAMWLSVP